MRESGTLLAEKHRERRKKKEKKRKRKVKGELKKDKETRKTESNKGEKGVLEKKKSMSFNSYQPPVRSQSTYYIIPSKLAYVNI